MFSNLYKTITTAAIASLAIATVAATPVLAAEAAQTDPVAVVAPRGEWMTLAPGESHWYQFHYDFIEKEGEIVSEAIAQLEMGTVDSVGFEVYTAEQAQEWAQGQDVTAIGMGSKKSDQTGNKNHDTKLVWANRSAGSETFYILVQNERNADSYYELNIMGEGISFPEAAVNMAANMNEMEESAPAEMAQGEMMATEEVAEVQSETLALTVENTVADVAMAGGFGPDEATGPSVGTVILDPGETAWYGFKYDYDGKGEPSQALVEVHMDVEGSVDVEIWTPDTVRLWTHGDSFDPLGRGSIMNQGRSDEDASTLVWAGGERTSGKYYVLVENDTQVPATYTLSISGPDVSF